MPHVLRRLLSFTLALSIVTPSFAATKNANRAVAADHAGSGFHETDIPTPIQPDVERLSEQDAPLDLSGWTEVEGTAEDAVVGGDLRVVDFAPHPSAGAPTARPDMSVQGAPSPARIETQAVDSRGAAGVSMAPSPLTPPLLPRARSHVDFDGRDGRPEDAELLRAVLADGTIQPNGARVNPFVFHARPQAGGEILFKARNAGLEGFQWSKSEIEQSMGHGSLLHHADGDYFDYVERLLAPAAHIPFVGEAMALLRSVRASAMDRTAKDGRLGWIVENLLARLRARLRGAAPSFWAKKARMYEIYSGVFNLPGWRQWRGRPAGATEKLFKDFSAEDLARIKEDGFDAIWFMGVFPVGERGRHGAGSLYSIRKYSPNPELGSVEDFRAFSQRAKSAGLKVIIDFVPNHTSMDSEMLDQHPEWFIHREVEGDPQHAPEGHFPYFSRAWNRWVWVSYAGYDSWGRKAYWLDVAQINVMQQGLRDFVVGMLQGWTDDGADGFRVDMAYQVTDRYFTRNWGLAPLGKEFLRDVISRVRERRPDIGFIAETYDLRDELSAMGFDAVYNKNDMDKAAGQYGWYDAWMHQDLHSIREAIRNVSFLTSQEGSAAGTQFIGNHDEAAPQVQYDDRGRPISGLGKLWKAAAVLTLMIPGSLLFYGSQEIGFNRPDPNDFPKSISFKSREPIDWDGYAAAHPEYWPFFHGLLEQSRQALQDGATIMKPLEPVGGGEPWVGFLLRSELLSGPRYAVLGNPTDRELRVRIDDARLKVHLETTLAPGDGRVIRL